MGSKLSWIRNCLSQPRVRGQIFAPQDSFQRVGSYDKVLRQTLSLAPSLSLSSLPTNEFEDTLTCCLMMIPLDDEGDDPDDDAAAAIDADDEKRIQFDCRTQLRSSWASGSQCNNAIGRSRCNSLIHDSYIRKNGAFFISVFLFSRDFSWKLFPQSWKLNKNSWKLFHGTTRTYNNTLSFFLLLVAVLYDGRMTFEGRILTPTMMAREWRIT